MKRILTAMTATALCVALAGCSTGGGSSSTQGESDKSDSQNTATVQEPAKSAADTKTEEEEPTPGLVDAKTKAAGPVILYDPYESGIHHAWLKIAGYPRMEIEIYSADAPKTSALFCKLVRKGYYDNMQLESLMPNLYAELGDASGKTDGKHLVTGEFEEAGFDDNHLGLKRGVIAMSRDDVEQDKTTKSGTVKTKTVTRSDAAHLYVFLTNASYLDGKYAGFAKITSGVSTFDKICADVQASVKTTKKGKIKKIEECPTIKYITLQD